MFRGAVNPQLPQGWGDSPIGAVGVDTGPGFVLHRLAALGRLCMVLRCQCPGATGLKSREGFCQTACRLCGEPSWTLGLPQLAAVFMPDGVDPCALICLLTGPIRHHCTMSCSAPAHRH